MKLSKIQAQLQELGYPDDPSTSLYIESVSGIKMLLGSYAALTDKCYIASVQKNGILFMGFSLMRHFNGTHHFVSYEDIGSVVITKTKFINGRMLLNADRLEITDSNDNKATYICYNFIAGERFWKDNIQNAQRMVDSWPAMSERKAKAAPAPLSAPAQPQTDVIDMLRGFKKLADEGVITQEDFDAKKKQLLNL